METMERKRPRPRRSFAPEFKADIVERCLAGDRPINQVAQDFDLAVSAVRGSVRQHEIDAGTREAPTTEEKEELSRLRRESSARARRRGNTKGGNGFYARRRGYVEHADTTVG